ncbi:hotdog domain-containing protein [Actinomadura formosensis]|uniref:hotdog domain-containing protein n=1 Tax=Actinomadura formosensis TaxID=60706 RepID=UPI00278BED08|nr:hotdog domain-containing protein [Actinomadura formosensis]
MINSWDICHGGFVASPADSAFALACNSYGEVTVTAGFDITFLEPARLGDTLVADASKRSRRGRSGLYDVTVTRISGQAPVVVSAASAMNLSFAQPRAEVVLADAPMTDGGIDLQDRKRASE